MRYLGMHQQPHDHWLEVMNQSKYRKYASDRYNEGPLIDELETRIAALLGKPDAMFFNKGVTCQLAALKVHCKQHNQVMLHPQSHIVQDEQDAYQALMGLEGVLVGQMDQPITLEDVQSTNQGVAVLVIELPLRRAGFKLPTWQQLLQLRQWCNEHQVIMHLDGARLWESANYYGLAWASIANLFDSVYVSLYKGLGGMSGAVLAGNAEFLTQCAVWRERLGSNMWSACPALITALHGMDQNLHHISSWVNRAKEIAKALQGIEGLIVDPPQTNGFQVKTAGNIYQLNNRLKALSTQLEISPCKPFAAIPNSKLLYTEIQVGAQHSDIKTYELVQFFKQLTAAT